MANSGCMWLRSARVVPGTISPRRTCLAPATHQWGADAGHVRPSRVVWRQHVSWGFGGAGLPRFPSHGRAQPAWRYPQPGSGHRARSQRLRGRVSSNGDKYPEPEGWGDDGFWRDPAIDSDYETGLTSPVRPAQDGPREDPGYSYWSDGKGWENSAAPGAVAGEPPAGGVSPSGGVSPFDAARFDAPRAPFGRGEGGLPGNGGQGEPTGFYGP